MEYEEPMWTAIRNEKRTRCELWKLTWFEFNEFLIFGVPAVCSGALELEVSRTHRSLSGGR
jgi:hypothetical protein